MTKVLMVFPRFNSGSFWNYRKSCEITGAKYPAAPLGLITVAAMLPPSWEVRLVDRNTRELQDADITWCDMVMTGGMLPQQFDALAVVEQAHRHGKPVIVGGPDATSSPHAYASADFRVLGEAEDVLKQFIQAWEAGERSGTFVAEKFQVDVTTTPVPRFDLINFSDYLYVGVQFSRVASSASLRHHRALWPQAADKVERTDAGGARCAARPWLSRPCRFCR